MRPSRLLVALAAGALLSAAGCGGAHSTTTRAVPQIRARPRRVLGQGAVRAGCSTAVATARPLPARAAFVMLGGSPFGVSVTPDGGWALVDELGGGASAPSPGGFFSRLVRTTPVPRRATPTSSAADEGHVLVLTASGFVPRLVRTIAVPQEAVGNSLTADGRYLLVADGGDGATVVSVRRAEAGDPHPVLGTLTAGSASGAGGGAIEVTTRPMAVTRSSRSRATTTWPSTTFGRRSATSSASRPMSAGSRSRSRRSARRSRLTAAGYTPPARRADPAVRER